MIGRPLRRQEDPLGGLGIDPAAIDIDFYPLTAPRLAALMRGH